jgi:hypothetical protein
MLLTLHGLRHQKYLSGLAFHYQKPGFRLDYTRAMLLVGTIDGVITQDPAKTI